MSIFTGSKAGNFVRGGQTTIHFIRMIFQVVKSFAWISLTASIVCYAMILNATLNDSEKQLTIDYSLAWYHAELFQDHNVIVKYHLADGRVINAKAINIVTNPGVRSSLETIQTKAIYVLALTAAIWVVALVLIIKFIYRTGRNHKIDEHVRGGMLVDIDGLQTSIAQWQKDNKEAPGNLRLFDIILPQKFEPAHVLIAGDPGTGKSNLFRQALQSIRNAGHRAIIYDRSGDFVKNFYRAGIDVILNPMDERSASWDIFKECRHEHEFINLAQSFIPEPKSNDPFWSSAARIIFSSMAIKESKCLRPSIENLVHNMLNLSLENMIDYCVGTDAQAVITHGGEKMAISIRGVMVTYVRALKFLSSAGNDGFSIGDWVKNDTTDSWIFITSNKKIHETIKPLITSWIDIACSSILSLEPSPQRRIWNVIDELPTLNKVPSIQSTPSESRKYGGCFILGFQNYPQLLDIYGQHGTAALCGSCSTAVIFRCNESSFAKWAANELGKNEQVETSESISYGVSEIRDGVNLGRRKEERNIVLPTELQNLPDLQGYIKLGRGFPVAKFEDTWRDYNVVASGYVERFTPHHFQPQPNGFEQTESDEFHQTELFSQTADATHQVEPVTNHQDQTDGSHQAESDFTHQVSPAGNGHADDTESYIDSWPTKQKTDHLQTPERKDAWTVNLDLEPVQTASPGTVPVDPYPTDDETQSDNQSTASSSGFIRKRRPQSSDEDSTDNRSFNFGGAPDNQMDNELE